MRRRWSAGTVILSGITHRRQLSMSIHCSSDCSCVFLCSSHFSFGFFFVCRARLRPVSFLCFIPYLSFNCHAPAGTGVFFFFFFYVCSSVSLLVSDPVFVGVSFSYWWFVTRRRGPGSFSSSPKWTEWSIFPQVMHACVLNFFSHRWCMRVF